jgi:hypothetical protein
VPIRRKVEGSGVATTWKIFIVEVPWGPDSLGVVWSRLGIVVIPRLLGTQSDRLPEDAVHIQVNCGSSTSAVRRASGIESRITIVFALSTGLIHETDWPFALNSTSPPPDDSSSSVALFGTGDPSTKDRMVAPPPSVPLRAL